MGITISSDSEEIVKDLQGNTKMTQIPERGAESRVEVSTSLTPMPIAGRRDLEHVKGANLLEGNLRYANAARAFLARADLRRADLSGADLRQADLRGARFDGAELFGSNLQGADLSFATGLTREQLASARLDTTTRLPEELGVPIPSLPSAR